MFRVIEFPGFLANPISADSLLDADQVVILMLIRDSCSAGPQAVIVWLINPSKVYLLLEK